MFTIGGFSATIDNHVLNLIRGVWHDNTTITFTQTLVTAAPEGDRTTLALAIHSFLNSLTISCLSVKERGGALTPRFNVYATGSLRTCEINMKWDTFGDVEK